MKQWRSSYCVFNSRTIFCKFKEQYSDGSSKKVQSFTKCSKKKQDKSCQADKSAHMWPVKPAMNMWSRGSAVPIQHKMSMKQIVPQEADKKCQATKYYKKVDKNCQTTNLQPVKTQMDMWSKEPAMQSSFKKKHVPLCSDKNCQSNLNTLSVTWTVNLCGRRSQEVICGQWPSPSIPVRKQVIYKKCNSDDKNCPSARKYSKKCEYTKCLCDDKNCQSANIM